MTKSRNHLYLILRTTSKHSKKLRDEKIFTNTFSTFMIWLLMEMTHMNNVSIIKILNFFGKSGREVVSGNKDHK